MKINEAKRILDRIDVIKAFVEGKSIQFKHDTSSTWDTFTSDNPGISCDNCQWRVAPEPREFWITIRNSVDIVYAGLSESSAALHSGELIKVCEVCDD